MIPHSQLWKAVGSGFKPIAPTPIFNHIRCSLWVNVLTGEYRSTFNLPDGSRCIPCMAKGYPTILKALSHTTFI